MSTEIYNGKPAMQHRTKDVDIRYTLRFNNKSTLQILALVINIVIRSYYLKLSTSNILLKFQNTKLVKMITLLSTIV